MMKIKAIQSKKLILVALFSGSLTSAAWADQCALISAEQAGKALDFLKPTGTIVEFCEPCGDKDFYSKPEQTITDIQASQQDADWSVKVNGKELDLAYTFVRNAEGSYLNLSKLANCPSDDVSVGFPVNTKVK
ncbi:hypothetical protein [uncultured Thiothrix sp.]|uniref:hypothetical protein n=1 Tax=uncultured Thiothrix sp. TaxID=223185 RepID=UPI00260DBA54|nr:hypothetical protein [uncultured Thiothrix sp.]